jgi:hypothetical protein
MRWGYEGGPSYEDLQVLQPNFVYALALSALRRAFQVLMFKTFITRVTFITLSYTLVIEVAF